MESYAPQNEKSGCRLTFFVLRSIRFPNPLSLTRHPPFRGNAGTCSASLRRTRVPPLLQLSSESLADAPARA